MKNRLLENIVMQEKSKLSDFNNLEREIHNKSLDIMARIFGINKYTFSSRLALSFHGKLDGPKLKKTDLIKRISDSGYVKGFTDAITIVHDLIPDNNPKSHHLIGVSYDHGNNPMHQYSINPCRINSKELIQRYRLVIFEAETF